MTEEELRALVRAAIAQHTGVTPPVPHSPPSLRAHPSHGLFIVPAGSDMEGSCIIEPAVMCNHCGYCKSLGH